MRRTVRRPIVRPFAGTGHIMARLIFAGMFLTIAVLRRAGRRSRRTAGDSQPPAVRGRHRIRPGRRLREAARPGLVRARSRTTAANAPIADLKLAPRNNRGLVIFSAEFLVLRPVEAARGNGMLLYEVNNRGNIGILRQLNERDHRQQRSGDRGGCRQRLSVPPRLYARLVGMGRRCRHDAGRQAHGAGGAGRHRPRPDHHRQGRLRSDRQRTERVGPLHRPARHRLSAGQRGRRRRRTHLARAAGRRAAP